MVHNCVRTVNIIIACNPGPVAYVNVLPIGAGMTVKYLFFKKRGFGADYLAGVKEGLATAGKCKKVGYRPEHLKNYLAIEWELFTGTLLYFYEFSLRQLEKRK